MKCSNWRVCLWLVLACVEGCTANGQCWSQGYEPGVGGGPLGPGQGGDDYGDETDPKPQGASGQPQPPCGDSAACEEGCQERQDRDSATCENLTVDEQRLTCYEAAQSRYNGCHQGCAAAAEGPLGERCRRECEAAKEERDAICRGLPTKKKRE